MTEANDPAIIALLEQKLNLQHYMSALSCKNALNATKLFGTPLLALATQTQVPIDILEQILAVVADGLVPAVQEFQYVTPRPRFRDPILDRFLTLPESGILEISGQAGAGKSNIAYQLAINERIFDISRSVVLISTEGKVPTQRLFEMAAGTNCEYDQSEILNGIMITEVESVDHLRATVQNTLPTFFVNVSGAVPSLVIIDSIAALFRLEYGENAAPARSRVLFDITTNLKWISATYNTLIVATNQATANITLFGASGGDDWVPALGLSWANCVNVRVRISKTHMKREVTVTGPIRTTPGGETGHREPQMVPIRTMHVEISPLRQDIRGEFYIDTAGVHGL